MRKSLCILLLYSFSGLMGQNSLLSTEMLPVGSMMELTLVQSVNPIDTTIKGSNVTWDFSGLQLSTTGNPLEVTVVDPANTPHGSSFPASNYAYDENNGSAYRYFTLNDSVLERVGSWSNGLLKLYSDPQVEYKFPFQLGTYNLDTWDNDASSFGGTYELRCLGDGKLILPNATYDRALMVYVEAYEIFTVPVYFWYSADNGAILLQYSVGDGLFVPTFGQVLTSLNVAASLESPELITSVRYQNPVESFFSLHAETHINTTMDYNISNAYGQVIRTGQVSQSPTQHHEIKINVESLSSGLYYLMVFDPRSPKERRSIKWIKR